MQIQKFQSNIVVMSMQMIFFAFFPCLQDVPYVFSWGSQRVHKFPIAPFFYPIWFAQSPTLMYLNRKGEP
jgi:hypothetical protein